MIKKFTLVTFLMLFLGFTAHTQLPDGSIAPDFTVTDLDGNEWNLYDILAEGKTVIIDAYATWCGPCWNYHEAGTLKDIWEQYGPDGTDEIFVIAIEADPSTSLGDIYGTGASTIGDWTEGVTYPMANNNTFGNLYNINFFPTLYTICPNRTLIESGQVSVADHYANIGGCLFPGGEINAGVLQYGGFEGLFCNDVSFEPTIKVQNIGSMEITSMDVELSLNSASTEVVNWTGTLAPYEVADVSFGEIMLLEDTELSINVTSVNDGMTDFNLEDNIVVRNTALGEETDQTVFTLEVVTDQYSAETYWELVDGNGVALYSGGNPGIFQGEVSESTYDQFSTNTIEMALPADGCYELNFYDFFGDGICCEYGDGSYTLTDANGNAVISGTGARADDQLNPENTPIELSGAEGVANNGAIVLYTGLEGQFCSSINYAPQVVIQNLGAEAITTMELEVSVNGTTQYVYDWTGEIAAGSFSPVSMDEFLLDASADINIAILSINGEVDAYEYRNELDASVEIVTPNATTQEEIITLNLVCDEYGYETYWQVTDDAGNVVASGGNTNVGPNGGGERVATPTDPGAYGEFEEVTQEITLPASGCYNFLIVDDYGDGICCSYGSGSYELIDGTGVVLASGSSFTTSLNNFYEANLVTSTNQLTAISDITVFPNPTSAELNVNFELAEAMPLNIEVFNALGQRVQ
ncbi:MAG: redoxin family protein, partial [Bacteroidota bacterium]